MTDYMLPASPNWYCSRVIDSNDRGLLCFGAKHSIYTVDTLGETPRFRGVISAHEDRVVGLSFCKADNEQNKVCSVSEDGHVKVWNLTSYLLYAAHAEHKNKLTSVHWSPADPNLIVSGDDRGDIIIWNLKSGETKVLSPERNTIFCLTCSPHVANYVAIGYKNGHMLLLDISKKDNGAILKKFKGHDDEIHSIVWCPKTSSELNWKKADSGDEPVDEKPDDHFLASGSKDKTVRVWCLTQNKPVYFLKLPQTSQRRNWDDSKQRLWVTLHWSQQKTNEIICSSFNGELLLWHLAASSKETSLKHFSGRNDCRAHARVVFNLTAVGKDCSALCSISMDRNLVFWDLESLTTRHVIPSCGGTVYCLAQSPIHPGRLAVGVGDNLIRVWNVENPKKPYNVNVYWQGIKSKVTALCWHPIKEGLLAFGTEDGKVGILDILSSRSEGSSTYHNRTVYVVTWGPPSYTTDDRNSCGVDYVLYSCGDSVVLQHNPAKLQDNALNINNIIRETNKLQGKLRGRSEISWKPDYSVVALGNEDGTIEIFQAGKLQMLCSVQVHRKLITAVRWHPEYTGENVEPSQNEFWIASGSNEPVVCVTDLRKSLKLMMEEKNTSPLVITECFCQLEGHTDRITSLSWSSHHQGQLVSASYDWTAQVWDVNKRQPLANYREHHGRLLCAVWSGIDPDAVYTGSDDFSVHWWKISQQTHKTPPAGSEKRKHRGKNRVMSSKVKQPAQPQQSEELKSQAEAVTDDMSNLTDTELSAIKTLLEEKKQELLQSAEASHEDTHLVPAANSSAGLKTMVNPPANLGTGRKEPKDKKKRKVRSLFPLSSTTDNRGKLQTQDDCVRLAEAKAKDPIPLLPLELCHLGHFLDRPNTYQLFDKESTHHLNHGNWEQYTILGTFRGDVGDTVRTLTERQELNDFAVALSAMASPSTWQATCQAYAAQLEKEGNYAKAATYLLAIHQVYEAIDLLQRSGHYKDAICLAQVRLSPADPVIKSLYSAWGDHLASDGNYEQAAKCYLASGQPTEAAHLLARRADLSALQVAAEISITCHDISNAKVYCHKYVQECMLNLDWDSAAKLVKSEVELKLYGLLISTHQSLLQQLHLLGCVKDIGVDQGEPYNINKKQPMRQSSDEAALPWLLLDVSDVEKWLPWEPYTVEGEVFMHHLVRQWHYLWELDMRKNSLEKLYHDLTTLSHAKQTHTAIKQVLIEVTCCITMAILDMMLSKDADAAKWMTIAMKTCYEAELEAVWEGLCRLLLPTGPNRFSNLCHEIRALRLSAIPQDDVGIDQVTAIQKCQSLQNKPTEEVDVKIYNDSEECTPVDCLKAFYNLKVLKSYLDGKSHQSSMTCQLSAQCILKLAHSLLWNAQLQRLMLEETLLQISKAMKGQNYQSVASEVSVDVLPGVDCDVEQTLVYPVTPDIKQVSIAAFVKENKMMEIRQSKQHDSSDQAASLTITALAPPCDIATEENPVSLVTTEGVVKLGSEFNSSPKKDDVQTDHCRSHPSSELTNRSGTGDDRNRHQIYPNVPKDWYTMPVDEKYKQIYIDMTILNSEQALAQKKLSQLKQNLKDVPFPNPEESVLLLVKLCELYQTEGGTTLLKSIVEWAQQHCYTAKTREFFSKYKIDELA